MPRGETAHLKPHQFKPGHPSANPHGRPKDPIPNALKKMTVKSYRRIIKSVCKGNTDQLKKIISNPKSSALEVAVASCFIKAIQKGDYGTVEQITSRVLGKIPDKLIVHSKNLNANLNANLDSAKVKAALEKLEREV